MPTLSGEDKDGLNHFDEILEEADGIILSRGNFGIDLQPEKLYLNDVALWRKLKSRKTGSARKRAKSRIYINIQLHSRSFLIITVPHQHFDYAIFLREALCSYFRSLLCTSATWLESPAVVTHVVDCMTDNLRPARAEATDVAKMRCWTNPMKVLIPKALTLRSQLPK
uniref:Pyruvate kinase n=1 Tax=Aegilops tauschii TaxID=37682 RepID=M8AYH5_AEGTA